MQKTSWRTILQQTLSSRISSEESVEEARELEEALRQVTLSTPGISPTNVTSDGIIPTSAAEITSGLQRKVSEIDTEAPERKTTPGPEIGTATEPLNGEPVTAEPSVPPTKPMEPEAVGTGDPVLVTKSTEPEAVGTGDPVPPTKPMEPEALGKEPPVPVTKPMEPEAVATGDPVPVTKPMEPEAVATGDPVPVTKPMEPEALGKEPPMPPIKPIEPSSTTTAPSPLTGVPKPEVDAPEPVIKPPQLENNDKKDPLKKLSTIPEVANHGVECDSDIFENMKTAQAMLEKMMDEANAKQGAEQSHADRFIVYTFPEPKNEMQRVFNCLSKDVPEQVILDMMTATSEFLDKDKKRISTHCMQYLEQKERPTLLDILVWQYTLNRCITLVLGGDNTLQFPYDCFDE